MCPCAMNYGKSLQILVDTLMDLDSNQEHVFIYLLSLLFLLFSSAFILMCTILVFNFLFLSFIKMVYIPPFQYLHIPDTSN